MPSRSLIAAIHPLLYRFTRSTDALTPEQRAALASAFQKLMLFALAQPADRSLLAVAVEGICRTCEADPAKAATALRRLISPTTLRTHGFAALFDLADEIPKLLTVDIPLVEDVYVAAFLNEDHSDEQTPMGGRILTLVSNRGQDYQLGLHKLANHFPDFLRTAPTHATRALVRVVDHYILHEHAITKGETYPEVAMSIGEHSATLRTDHSYIWDQGTWSNDDEMRMVDAWEHYVGGLADDAPGLAVLGEIALVLARENRTALLWRRLLKVALDHAGVAMVAKPLLAIPEILTGSDTEEFARPLLRALFGSLGESERERIERAVVAITDESERRDLVALLVPRDTLVTEEAVLLAAEVPPADEVEGPRTPRFRVGHGPTEWLPDREEELLRAEGVPIDAPSNQRLRALQTAAIQAAERLRNRNGSAEDVASALGAAHALHDQLASAAADGVHPAQSARGFEVLADACALIAENGQAAQIEGAIPFLRECFLKAARASEPKDSHSSDDASFDEGSPTWGSSLHISAAQGLLSLAWHVIDDEMRSAIEGLSRDAAKQVRFRVGCRLSNLSRNAPDLLWEIADRLSLEEPKAGVLQGLLRSIHWLAGREPDRATEVAKRIYERLRGQSKAASTREQCIDVFLGLYVWQGQPTCGEMIRAIVGDPAAQLEAARHLPFGLRKILTDPQVSSSGKESVWKRAVETFVDLTKAATEAFRATLPVQGQESPAVSEERRSTIQGLAQLVDGLGGELYFASGAHKSSDEGEYPITGAVQERFYRDLGPALDCLAEIGLPSLAHRLVEILEEMVPIDPVGVFLRLAIVVANGEKWGYAQEALAADRIVAIVTRYLADYRHVLQENDAARRALLTVLDAFVGWPAARSLLAHLEDVYR